MNRNFPFALRWLKVTSDRFHWNVGSFAALATIVCAFSSSADVYQLNFEGLFTEDETQHLLTPTELKTYLNDSLPLPLIKEIPYANLCFSDIKGLGAVPEYNTSTGGLFIYSDEKDGENNVGGFKIAIDPKYVRPIDRINFVTFKNPMNLGSNALDTEIEVSINNDPFKRYSMTTDSKVKQTVKVELPEGGDPVFTMAVRIPNPLKKENPDSNIDYYVAFSKITFVYTPQDLAQPTTWEFAVPAHVGIFGGDDEYEMPKLRVNPSWLSELAIYSSSNPEVADFEDGKLRLKSVGNTVINAKLDDNFMYRTVEASYQLTVHKNTSTVVMEIESEAVENDAEVEFFDLTGRKLSGVPSSGLYIMVKGSEVTKKLF